MAFQSIASGARHGLSYIRETTPGQTPANPALTRLRHTSCTLGLSRDNFQSDELRSDRMIPFVRTGCDKIGGGLNIELSYGEFDPLLEGALFGVWTDDALTAGTTTHSFTFQRTFGDIGRYGVYRGCYVNQLSLSLKPNAMITGGFEIVGLSGEYGPTPLDPAPGASRTGGAFDSYTGSLKETGTEIAVVTGLDLTLNNNINAQFGLFSKTALAVSPGRSTLTGTLTAFFQDTALLEKFLQESPASLEFTLRFGGDSYIFLIPSVVYTGAQIDVSDEGPIQQSLPWSAVLGDDAGTNFRITRVPASAPPAPKPKPDPGI